MKVLRIDFASKKGPQMGMMALEEAKKRHGSTVEIIAKADSNNNLHVTMGDATIMFAAGTWESVSLV